MGQKWPKMAKNDQDRVKKRKRFDFSKWPKWIKVTFQWSKMAPKTHFWVIYTHFGDILAASPHHFGAIWGPRRVNRGPKRGQKWSKMGQK